MKILNINYLTFFIVVFSTATPIYSYADDKVRLKLSTIAPKGSVYHRALQEMGESWRKMQNNGSRFIIYPDGTQGTESNSVRRMRIGQLDAAMLSVAGLKEIDNSVAALQLMPLMFRSWEEYDYVHKHLRADIEKRFLKKGFVVLFWGEGGWVRFFSTLPRISPEEYKTAKIFQWSGNPQQVEIMKSLDYRPIVIELTDILTSLQTGMIDVVPVTPMWALAFQLYSKTNHMLNLKWVPIVGATVITTKSWNALSPTTQENIRNAAAQAGSRLRDSRSKQDENTIKAMQSRGLIVHDLDPEQQQAWQGTVKDIWERIRGDMVPADKFDQVVQLLNEYRQKNEHTNQLSSK